MSTTTSTEQTLDELKELFAMSMLALKHSHEETRRTMGTELSQLKEDLAAAKAQQEDATERALKLARRERSLDFNRKGHEEQFVFNQQVQDNIAGSWGSWNQPRVTEKNPSLTRLRRSCRKVRLHSLIVKK